MLCCCFFLYLFLTILVRPVISKSTGPIFAKFSGLVEHTAVDDQSEISFFFDSSMNLAMVTKFCSFQCMVVAGRRRLAAVSRQRRPTHCICQVAPMCICIMHGGLRPTQVCSQKWHLGRFFRFCRAEVTVVTNAHTDHAIPPVARGRMCTMHARRPKK